MDIQKENKIKEAIAAYKDTPQNEKKAVLKELKEEAMKIRRSVKRINDLVFVRKKEQEIKKKM